MATEAEVIVKIRRRVADYKEPRLYEKAYYQDAIAEALSALSYDYDATYSVASDVPADRVFLLVKLAAIEMCYMRASEGAEGSGDEGEATRFTSIAVPDLSVSDANAAESRGPAYWLELAKRLREEYDDAIEGAGGEGEYVQVEVTRRISLTHGGYRKRKLDPGLPAVTVDSPVVDGNDILITWSKLQREDFLYYEITRATSSTFSDEEVVRQEPDIHEIEFLDEGLLPGTYWYRVKSVNPNDIKTNSSGVSATVS